MGDDLHLLRRYAAAGPDAQAAFAALVARHLDLVYAVALRTVRAPDLAADVAQSVFFDLSRTAPRYPAETPVVAWLHVVTRRTAIDLVRAESRRAAREHAASTDAALAPAPSSAAPSPDGPHLEPLLDEAVASLAPADRTAILLRFFENRSLREVGAALGLSDDAAQKRVARALDRLRTFLVRRGLPLSSAALAAELGAAVVPAAPAALAAAITASVSGAALSVAAPAAGAVAMTTLQKSLVAAAVVVTAGAGLVQTLASSGQTTRLAALHARADSQQHRVAASQREIADLTRRLAEVDGEIDARLLAARRDAAALPTSNRNATLAAWVARARRLQSFAATHPHLAIPEFRLLTTEHWAEIAAQHPVAYGTESEAALQASLAAARRKAEGLFAPLLHSALQSFLRASDSRLPDSLYELLPHFASPISPELFSRYRLTAGGRLSDAPASDRNNFLIEIRSDKVVDPETDNIVSVGAVGFSTHSARAYEHARAAVARRAAAAPAP
jgi:RNA polymerase sigma factor (sigma-70 family)